MKFKVGIDTPEEFDGELGLLTVTNRAGRKWIAKKPEHMDNIGEELMCLEEWLAEGGKLKESHWTEATASI